MSDRDPSGDRALKPRLSDLEALDYTTIIRKKDGRFCLIIPELSLVAVGEDLDAAYAELGSKRRELFERYLEFGIEDKLSPPSRDSRRVGLWPRLKVFALKTLIICLLAGLTVFFTVGAVANRMGAIGVAVIESAPQQLAKRIYREIERFNKAEQAGDKARMEEIKKAIRALRPIILEFMSLVEKPDPAGTEPPSPPRVPAE